MQFLAIGSLVMGWPAAVPFAWGAFGLGLTALIDYVRRAITIGQKRLADTRRRETKMTTTRPSAGCSLPARFRPWGAIVPTCRRRLRRPRDRDRPPGQGATRPRRPRMPLAAPARPLVGVVERLDPALDALIAPDARPEVLSQGYKWSEGPVWTGGALLFSDVPNNVVWRWSESRRRAQFLRPSGYTGTVPRGGEPGSNGLAVDAAGRLYLCQHGDRRIARLAPDGKSFETVADRYDGKRFNSPNDLVVRPNGDVYFTDPIYGLVGHEKDPAREMPWSGVYRAHADGGVDVLDKTLTLPERPGVLARRQDALRRGVRSGARDLDGLRRRRRRAASRTGASSSTRRRS